MNKKKTSVDGFVLNRPNRDMSETALDREKDKPNNRNKLDAFEEAIIDKHNTNTDIDLDENNRNSISQTGPLIDEIQDSLRQIGDQNDYDNDSPKQRKHFKKELKLQKKSTNSLKKKIIKDVVVLVLLVVLAFLAYGVYRFLIASDNIFEGNIFDTLKSVPLKQDTNGRSNFLILGTSEDDPDHEGANLTDTMMVVSVSQDTKDAHIFSIPRDLYVKYNRACLPGYSGKINAYFYCVNDQETAEAEQDRLAQTKDFIGDILGLEMHYAIRVNYTVVKEAVDAVGGIEVDIQGSGGAPGILDRHFDYLCDYKCYMVKYKNGVHKLDGAQALNLARVRGESAPTYGLARSNFDREVNQQKIVIALKNKAISSGTITNFNKIMKLIDALGNNLRTNIQTKEMKTIVSLVRDIEPDNVYRLSLVGDDGLESVLTTADSNVIPRDGYFNYDSLRSLIKKNLTSNPVEKEASKIIILNGSKEVGLAQSKSKEISSLGLEVVAVDNAPDGKYKTVEIYQKNTQKSATAKKLSEVYKVDIKISKPPINLADDIDFVIIFGNNPLSD